MCIVSDPDDGGTGTTYLLPIHTPLIRLYRHVFHPADVETLHLDLLRVAAVCVGGDDFFYLGWGDLLYPYITQSA